MSHSVSTITLSPYHFRVHDTLLHIDTSSASRTHDVRTYFSIRFDIACTFKFGHALLVCLFHYQVTSTAARNDLRYY